MTGTPEIPVDAPWQRWRRQVRVAATRHNGWGVFAVRPFASGQRVLLFTGPRRRRHELDEAAFEHALQIGPDAYLGPSGGEDDYVNHSCAPNTTLQGRRQLVALRPIRPGEEITMDYASCTQERGWRMACRCGSPACRGTITSYWQSPPELRGRPHFRTWPSRLPLDARNP